MASVANLPVVKTPEQMAEAVELAVMRGDLAGLTSKERLWYVAKVSEQLGINPLLRPFDFISTDDGKVILYTRREATEQLRKNYNISIRIKSREVTEKGVTVTVTAEMPVQLVDGSIYMRYDEATGDVPYVKKVKGQRELVPMDDMDRSNAIMKAETKAKRRATLSICGLGWTDESELDQIKGVDAPQADKLAIADKSVTVEDMKVLEAQFETIKS